MKIKQIATVIAGALMVGATMGAASAASYPTQILGKNVAVVVGTDGADATDQTVATAIEASLDSAASGLSMSSTTVTGGEEFVLEKSSVEDKLYFGDSITDEYATIDGDEMDFLADGEYDSEDVDSIDYEQSITITSKTLDLIKDDDLNDDEPTVGLHYSDGDAILSYTLSFKDDLNVSLMDGSDMPLLGGEYYVQSATATKIVLLDSADSTLLSEGETVTVGGKTVSIAYIEDGEVKLTVDGESTKTLNAGDDEELDDGSFIAVTEVLFASKDTGTSKVEFSIGTGKIVLENGKELVIGDEDDVNADVDNVDVTLTSTTTDILDSITIAWAADDDLFLVESETITMPGLSALSLSYDDLAYASDVEEISLDKGDELTLQMGNFDLPLMWYNTTAYLQGDEQNLLKIASPANVTNTTAGYANDTTTWFGWDVESTSYNMEDVLSVQLDDRFVLTEIDAGGDLSDSKTLYFEVSELDVDNDNSYSVELKNLYGGDTLTYTGDEGSDISADGQDDETEDITVTLMGFNSDNDTAYLAIDSSVTDYNKVISEKGLVVTIPTAAEDAVIAFKEANVDGDINAGDIFTATVSNSSNDKLSAELATGNVSEEETTDADNYKAIVTSELATIIMADKSNDDNEYTFDIEYTGEPANAEVAVIAGGVSSTDAGEISAMVVNDDADTTGKNLVVVGGNCVNAVARTLLGLEGGADCLAAFEESETVGNGGVLIESFDHEGAIALLVAGYSAADTVKAEVALKAAEGDLDVSVGKRYVLESTTAADATLVAA